jgi:ABC-type multidrug transport system ATPase subunit
LQLKYFATIKGQCVHVGKDGLEERQHSKESIEQMAENLIADLGLSSDADNEAKTLSQPAKRKLSLAIALIGDPQVSFFFVVLG